MRDTGGDEDSGAKTLVHEDARADIAGSIDDPRTGRAQAVSVNSLKNEWKVIDPAIAADLETLKAIGPGHITVSARTLDDKTWIVAYSATENPAVYYRYVRGGTPEMLFSARPTLEGTSLVAMWPQEIRSRDGLTLVSYLSPPKTADADNDGKADKPVPLVLLVLLVHSGPWARDEYGCSPSDPWLANRGTRCCRSTTAAPPLATDPRGQDQQAVADRPARPRPASEAGRERPDRQGDAGQTVGHSHGRARQARGHALRFGSSS